MTDPFRLRYDSGSDVLYVSIGQAAPAYGEEGDAPGLVWRYRDADNVLIGVTVMDFHSYWKPRFTKLLSEFSEHFGIPKASIRKALDEISH